MTKCEAMSCVMKVSSGTVAVLTGKTTYKELADILNDWLDKIQAAAPGTFWQCENWMDVLELIGVATKEAA